MPEIFFSTISKVPRSKRPLNKRKGKKMPRVPRINIENALYYITSRGDSSEEIFKEGSDYAMYIDLLKKSKDEYKFKLFAFCLVPTHLHLLIELAGDTTISQIMHSLNSNYTKYFNSKHKRTGHLFQERYRMVLVEKEPNLLNITAYIHLNPKAMNLCPDIADYAYSSYPIYIEEDRGKQRMGIDIRSEIREVLGLLKNATYADFITTIPAGEMQALGRNLAKKAILGSAEFVENIKSKVESEKQKAEELASMRTRNPLVAKTIIAAGGAAIIILGAAIITLYIRALAIRNTFNKELQNKNAEITAKLIEEKQKIRQDLDEKYRADMVSFEALSKRLEAEKKKAAELEKELKAAPSSKK